LGGALLISFILVYLVMVALYDSFLYPFVVLFSIPVAVIGAFLALNLTLSTLSLFTLLGLIMLLGLVSKNAILIVDRANQLKAEGMHYAWKHWWRPVARGCGPSS
jgi:HAE1 family hydrophobic/amphiphilic exporter-1